MNTINEKIKTPNSGITLPAVSLVTSRSGLSPGGERSSLLGYEEDVGEWSQEEGFQLEVRDQLGTAATHTDPTHQVNRKSKTADKPNLPAGWKTQIGALATHHPHGDTTMAEVTVPAGEVEVIAEDDSQVRTAEADSESKVDKEESSGWTEGKNLPADWFSDFRQDRKPTTQENFVYENKVKENRISRERAEDSQVNNSTQVDWTGDVSLPTEWQQSPSFHEAKESTLQNPWLVHRLGHICRTRQ